MRVCVQIAQNFHLTPLCVANIVVNQIWAGVVTDPAKSEKEALPRTVSMVWGDVCDSEVGLKCGSQEMPPKLPRSPSSHIPYRIRIFVYPLIQPLEYTPGVLSIVLDEKCQTPGTHVGRP